MNKYINEKAAEIPTGDLLEQLDDIVNHKQFVYESFRKMSRYFIQNGRTDVALNLMNRCFSHDVSKLREGEFLGMAKFAHDKSGMTDINIMHPAEGKMEAIRLHWISNSHHPEFWDNSLHLMGTYDIIEMMCDWYARTLQFNNSLMEWIEHKCYGDNARWNFSERQKAEILHYASILTTEEENWDNLELMAID